MDLKDLYREVILDHNKQPAQCSAGSIRPTASADGHNPLCGDRLHITRAAGGRSVERPALRGQGLRHLGGLGLADDARPSRARSAPTIAHLFHEVHEVLTKHDAPVPEDLGKLAALSGVREFPARVKCASLCWHTLQCGARAQRRDGQDRVTDACAPTKTSPSSLSRDVEAVMVPAGIEIEAQAGQSGFITQALGGSFTLYIGGQPVPHRRRGCRRHRQGSDARRRELPPECDRR